MMEEIKILAIRFLRGFIAGAVGSMITVGVFAGTNLTDFQQWIGLLGIAAMAGGITGGLLALDKAIRFNNE